MSRSTVSNILDRCDHAEPERPIAVFICKDTCAGHLNSMFARTVVTQNLIDNENPNLVGIYHKAIRREYIREQLHKAISNYQGMIL